MKKIMVTFFAILMLLPFSVFAGEKTDAIVEDLRESAKAYNGTVELEDNTINIDWVTKNTKYSELSYNYSGNIIEYETGELTSYEDAGNAISHTIYASYLLNAALKVNGYTDDEINKFFSSDVEPSFETNGIEIKHTGEDKEFTSADGTMKTTMSPISIKIDVSRADIGDSKHKGATIEDLVEYLNSDSEFLTTKYDGEIISENLIELYEDEITISNYYYEDDYHHVEFLVEDDILVYEDGEITTFEEAESALSHQLYATQIITDALKLNGYSIEEINEFFANENEPTFDINGIETKKLGEKNEYVSSDGTETLYVTPVSIKVDFTKANIGDIKYKTLEGDNQNIIEGDTLTFRFDIDYSKFSESGKVYLDEKEVSESNYTSKKGSTIITFNSDYVKTLKNGNHTIKVTVDKGYAEANFTINPNNTVENPNTLDNISFYIGMFGLGLIGIIGSIVLNKKYVTE